jgi:lipopolysaccharide transport system ATP-binding protein
MNTVIEVENLSKKYIIEHKQQERYQTLRDNIAQKLNQFGRRLRHPFQSSSGQPLMGLSTTEEMWALKDVSFEIKKSERIGIIGRNGVGKTTLLKILSRITEPTEGRVWIKGRVATLLEVGTGFHPELTGRENIFLNGAVLGMTKAEIKKRFDEIVTFAEVQKFLDTPVKRYSSGMYVRLAFAVAAHLEPEILLVDEVLAVGDVAFQKKCLGKMSDVSAKEGRTILFVSHNMGAIQQLCDRVIFIHDGKVKKIGETTETINSYIRFIQNLNDYGDCLSDIHRIGNYGQRVRIVNGWLIDSDENETTQYVVGEQLKVYLEFEAYDDDYEDLHVNIGINTAQQMRIVTVTTRTNLGYLSCKKNKKASIIANFDGLVLAPGRYDITLTLGNRGRPLDLIKEALFFDVIETGADQTVYHPQLMGLIRSNVSWKILE